jgi:hypothetical protein
MDEEKATEHRANREALERMQEEVALAEPPTVVDRLPFPDARETIARSRQEQPPSPSVGQAFA